MMLNPNGDNMRHNSLQDHREAPRGRWSKGLRVLGWEGEEGRVGSRGRCYWKET